MEKNNLTTDSIINRETLVSIGIPVFNGERYLSHALDSVLLQDYKNIEIIISDNASTDKTAEICHAYMLKDERIRYFRYSENKGAAKNYSKVLQESTGTYFTWLASDDLFYTETYISNIINFMKNHADVVLCNSAIRTFYDEDPQANNDRIYNSIFNNIEWKKAQTKFFTYPPQVELMVYGIYKTEILKKIPTAYKNIKHPDLFAAFIILPRLCSYGRIVALPEVHRAFRCNLDSLSYTISGKDLYWYALQIKLSLLQVAFNFPAPWAEKIRLIKTTLLNFLPFKRSVSMKHELKQLRKEITMLRKVCAERLELINKLADEVNKR